MEGRERKKEAHAAACNSNLAQWSTWGISGWWQVEVAGKNMQRLASVEGLWAGPMDALQLDSALPLCWRDEFFPVTTCGTARKKKKKKSHGVQKAFPGLKRESAHAGSVCRTGRSVIVPISPSVKLLWSGRLRTGLGCFLIGRRSTLGAH